MRKTHREWIPVGESRIQCEIYNPIGVFHYPSDQCTTNTPTAVEIAHKLLGYFILQFNVCNVIITRLRSDARILDGRREIFIS